MSNILSITDLFIWNILKVVFSDDILWMYVRMPNDSQKGKGLEPLQAYAYAYIMRNI